MTSVPRGQAELGIECVPKPELGNEGYEGSVPMSMGHLRERLLSSGLASPRSLVGCTPQELRAIMDCAGRDLPATYFDFMRICGRRAGRLFRDIEMFYPTVLNLRDDALDILSDLADVGEAPLDLPDDAFVFATRQGMEFAFFRVGDDPLVEMYYSKHTVFRPTKSRFSEFVWNGVSEYEYYYNQVKGTVYDFYRE